MGLSQVQGVSTWYTREKYYINIPQRHSEMSVKINKTLKGIFVYQGFLQIVGWLLSVADASPPPRPCKIIHKKMGAKEGRIDFTFLAPPYPPSPPYPAVGSATSFTNRLLL